MVFYVQSICFNLNIILLVIILIILIFVVLSIRFVIKQCLTEKIDTLLDKQNKNKLIEKQDNESIETQVIVSIAAINNRVELNDPLRPPYDKIIILLVFLLISLLEYVNYHVGILKIIQVIINYYHCMENNYPGSQMAILYRTDNTSFKNFNYK